MSTPLRDVIAECDRLLEPERFDDYGPNGLQFPGRSQVRSIVSAVSAQVELFALGRQRGADLILVHHGIFWGAGPSVIDTPLKARLVPLFEADMSLAAYHLPLDAHPVIGNNALLADAIGAQDTGPFGKHRGEAVGRLARFAAERVTPADLVARVERVTGRPPLTFAAGPARIRDIAVVSGAGASFLAEAIALGVDAFLTGEPAERVMAQSQEARIHFLAAGHYATETLGVQRLGEHLARRFGVEHAFLDLPNPV